MKVGDRVRIVCEYSNANGKEAIIWDIETNPNWSPKMIHRGVPPDATAYRVEIEGQRYWPNTGKGIAFQREDLRPILPEPKFEETTKVASWDDLSEMLGTDIRKGIRDIL